MPENESRESERLGILRALDTCLNNTVHVMTLVADSVDDHDAVRALKAQFGFDELQARAVLAMQVRRFSASEKNSLRAEIAELETANEG